MSYATQAELVERYGTEALIELTDRSDPADAIDATVVSRALTDTDAAIDGYLKGRYTLPLLSTPPLLRDIALPIAFYKLHRAATTDKVRQDYEDAMRMLREIAAGTMRLDIEGSEPASSGATGVRTSDRERDLTPDNLKGFI